MTLLPLRLACPPLVIVVAAGALAAEAPAGDFRTSANAACVT